VGGGDGDGKGAFSISFGDDALGRAVVFDSEDGGKNPGDADRG